MKEAFDTSAGTLEVHVHQESRKISIYRFNDQHRAVAAAIEDWDYVDLVDVLTQQVGVPATEADPIATYLREKQMSLDSPTKRRRGRLVRNLVRLIDTLFFYRSASSSLASSRGRGEGHGLRDLHADGNE